MAEMELRMKREVLLGGVQRTLGIVDRRTTMPILNNVLLIAEGGQLRIVATDREIGLIADYEAEIVLPGEITLSARKLYEMIRELQGEDIHFKKDDSNWVQIACDRVSYKVAGIPAEEFPKVADDDGMKFFKVKGHLIGDMIKMTYFAMSTDESRVNLNGVFMKAEKGEERTTMTMAATDGHRLAFMSVEPEMETAAEMEKGVIIPRKGINEIRKMVENGEEEVEIGVRKGMCVVRKRSVVLKVSLVDAEYPDYRRVIPKDRGMIVELDKDQMLRALRRMSVMSSERYMGVKIKLLEGKMVLNSTNPDLGEASEEIEVTYDDAAVEVGFNVRYLMDVIEVIPERRFIFEVRGGLRPAVIKPAETKQYMCIIMPLKI